MGPTSSKKSGAADRVAAVLREQIVKGLFPPGLRLSEEALGSDLGVARNTLREAFRMLSQERLVVHRLNRGVFVRELTVAEIEDLYRLRSAIEIAALSQGASSSPNSGHCVRPSPRPMRLPSARIGRRSGRLASSSIRDWSNSQAASGCLR